MTVQNHLNSPVASLPNHELNRMASVGRALAQASSVVRTEQVQVSTQDTAE